MGFFKRIFSEKQKGGEVKFVRKYSETKTETSATPVGCSTWPEAPQPCFGSGSGKEWRDGIAQETVW